MMFYFSVCIVILIFCIIYTYYIEEVIYVTSTIDNNTYLIRRGSSKSETFLKDSANTLAGINMRVSKLIKHLHSKYSQDTEKNYYIKMLKLNYNHSILSEAAVDKRYTTFTVDKQDMHICLRTRDAKENIYDTNLLMYVVLHELAHLCNYDKNGYAIQGHGVEFREIFKLLVKESIDIQVYEYVNYAKYPIEYCGITLTSSIL